MRAPNPFPPSQRTMQKGTEEKPARRIRSSARAARRKIRQAVWTRGRDTPVAVRLVATYGLIVAATLLVVAGLAYDLTRRQLARDFDTQLQATVGSFERAALQ